MPSDLSVVVSPIRSVRIIGPRLGRLGEPAAVSRSLVSPLAKVIPPQRGQCPAGDGDSAAITRRELAPVTQADPALAHGSVSRLA